MAGNKGVFLAVALAVLPVTAHAQGQSLQSVAEACTNAVQRQLHCASCGSAWPEVTECIVTNDASISGQVNSEKLKSCMRQIWDSRLQNRTPAYLGDPISASLRCAGAAL